MRMLKPHYFREMLVFICFITIGLLSIRSLSQGLQRYIQGEQHVGSPVVKFTKVVNTNQPYTSVAYNKQTIDLSINDEKFTPNEINLQRNSIVTLHLHVYEGYHNFILPVFAVNSTPLATDKSETIMFIATMSGDFTFFSQPAHYKTKVVTGIVHVD